jgi:hypothetical protein
MPTANADSRPTVFIDPSGLQSRAVNDNDCPKDASVQGACIAFLCSFKNVKDMIDALKTAVFPPDKLRKVLEWIKGMYGKTFPPEDCCKNAYGHPKGLGCKLIFSTKPPYLHCELIPPDIERVIKWACSFTSDLKSSCFMVCTSRDLAGCLAGCKSMTGTLSQNKCEDRCRSTEWINGVATDGQCQCGVKR